MKIAITADCHLTSQASHPERYNAFINILDQMLERRIHMLIAAGDLFDQSVGNYSGFEQILGKEAYQSIRLLILPGNHDGRLTSRVFTAENIEVISEPVLLNLDKSALPLLFIPYSETMTMGGAIQAYGADLKPGGWILVGHGDWIGGLTQPNPLEPSVYMPLTRRDVETFHPVLCLLGHAHKSAQHGNICIPGSPFPMDINETGPRRFLILDTAGTKIESVPVSTDYICYNETLFCIPGKYEEKNLEDQISAIKSAWKKDGFSPDRTRIRLRCAGYTADKQNLLERLKNAFREYTFYKDENPDLSDVFLSDDPDREAIANRLIEKISIADWSGSVPGPSWDDVMMQALHTIYGAK